MYSTKTKLWQASKSEVVGMDFIQPPRKCHEGGISMTFCRRKKECQGGWNYYDILIEENNRGGISTILYTAINQLKEKFSLFCKS